MRMQAIGLVGLGLMGSAMSTRLLSAGHTVVGYDVAPAARDAHAARGGEVVGAAGEVAARCRVVILSLPNGQISRSACFDPDGVAAGVHEGSVVVETSTVLPDEAERMASDLVASGAGFTDAALSGHSEMVGRGDALGMVGGEASDAAVVTPILDAFCRKVMHVGGHGDGMRAKIVVNQILTINRFAVAEGLVLAEKLGVDVGRMLEVLRSSAAYSKAMDMWGDRMVDRRYTDPASRVNSHDKDARLTLQLGREHHAPMLLTSQVNQIVQSMLASGMADLDNSSVVEALRGLAGIETRLPDTGR
ncbi:MAG TPA: NAD(P)-dependent oxidoreductase [Nocardioidaceae bacterium]|nr:NAD(P)-dependent oxidoreductase [Nocardioidaceae bacterium]